MTRPLRFAFGIHIHQPIGNFDHVFESHVRDVYEPFLQRITEHAFFPIVLHVSGPLLLWLEERGSAAYIDRVGRLVADGKVELLSSGLYEPILAALPRADRVEQIGWMGDTLQRLFGVSPTGVWLTERVWEPELAEDLADAGVAFALVDDRHFLTAGFDRDQLSAPFLTEGNGKRLALFSIDERMRYLIPFAPPEAVAEYLRTLRDAGHQLTVMVDDGEKFGGWPGTQEWVYEKNWLGKYLDAMLRLMDDGVIQLTTLSQALEEVPSGGLAYLPTASYREMEEWALPPAAATRLSLLKRDLGKDRVEADGGLLRGSHWKHFFVKYPETNRMHKKMMALSALCRAQGNPPRVRHEIGKAQCNDAYWHGVFGGLYLPHLRQVLWRHLAAAERVLREQEPLAAEVADIDNDGHDEVWVHSAAFSAIVNLRLGGMLVEHTLFESGVNSADVLTRRFEAYHANPIEEHHGDTAEGLPSIHHIEAEARTEAPPPVDADERGLFVERVLSGDLSLAQYQQGGYDTLTTMAGTPMRGEVGTSPDAVDVTLRPLDGPTALSANFEKRLRFEADGSVTVTYRWDADGFGDDAWFTTEISHRQPLDLRPDPEADVWTHPITTVAKAEHGLEETLQGTSTTLRWLAKLGAAQVRLDVSGAS